MLSVESLDDYLSKVAMTRERWLLADHKELWFRAEDEEHADTHLLPGLYRPVKPYLRKPIPELLEIERGMYDDFARLQPQLYDRPIGDGDFDAYFLMQHHGVPTRLLDWTDGALIALHFSVNKKQPPFETGAIIYVMNPHWLVNYLKESDDQKNAADRWGKYVQGQIERRHYSEFDEDEWDRLYLPFEDEEKPELLIPANPILWDSPHISRRIAAQRSRFMIFGSDPSWLINLANGPSSQIESLHIPSKIIGDTKAALRDTGITESVIFPDLDGLGKELRQMWDARHWADNRTTTIVK